MFNRRKICLLSLALTFVLYIYIYISDVEAAVKLNKTSATIYVGDVFQLKVTGTTKRPTFSSSDRSVASVTQSGVVAGVKSGSATITAKVEGKSYKCKVTVKHKAVVLYKAVYGYDTKVPYRDANYMRSYYGIDVKSASKTSVKFQVFYIAKKFAYRYTTSTITAKISANKGTFSWKDNWGNKGTGTLVLIHEKQVMLTMKETHRASYNKGSLKCSNKVLDWVDETGY